jgi:transglutaminase-like putative cysteine protease
VSTGDLGPIYLRGLPIVDVDGRRREDMSRLRDVQDPDDGQVDGWCELAPRARAADTMVLAVHGIVPEIAPTGEVVVFCPPATSSVELPRVRADPQGGVVAPREPGATSFDYRLLARLPSRVPFPRITTRVLGGDPRTRNSSTPVPGTLEVAAFRASSGSTNDLDRVRDVMRYLRGNFAYEQIEGRFDPVDGLSKFAAERHGTCLQFAEAGVVMLRTLGIAARVGRGFLLVQWDDERRLYVARAADAHAWVEVEFEGCGFVVFDPTPRAAQDATVDAPPGRDESTTPPDAPTPPAETPPSSNAGARLEQVIDDVRDALGRAWDWITENPWPCLAAFVAATLVGARALDRRARRLAGEVVDARAARGPWERLLADLARRGHRRRPSQTELEFAAAVVASGGDALRRFLELTQNRQATKFGGLPPSLDEARAIESFRATL